MRQVFGEGRQGGGQLRGLLPSCVGHGTTSLVVSTVGVDGFA
ncbi:unnamed protein product [Ectocarpus sp. 6 AP-2014]